MYNIEDDDELRLSSRQKDKITAIGMWIVIILLLGIICSSCESNNGYPEYIGELTQEQYNDMRAELEAYRNYYHGADSIFNCCIDSTGDIFFKTDEGLLINELSYKVDSTVLSHSTPQD